MYVSCMLLNKHAAAAAALDSTGKGESEQALKGGCYYGSRVQLDKAYKGSMEDFEMHTC